MLTSAMLARAFRVHLLVLILKKVAAKDKRLKFKCSLDTSTEFEHARAKGKSFPT